MRSKGTAAELEARRRIAVKLLQEGKTPREVADFLGVHRRTVERWRNLHRQQGEEGLKVRPSSGRPPRLSPTQEAAVSSWLTQSPREFGYSTDLWTARRIRELIRKQFEVEFHVRYVCAWLKQRKITPQKPRRRPRQRNEATIRAWTSQTLPRLVKRGIATKPT